MISSRVCKTNGTKIYKKAIHNRTVRSKIDGQVNLVRALSQCKAAATTKFGSGYFLGKASYINKNCQVIWKRLFLGKRLICFTQSSRAFIVICILVSIFMSCRENKITPHFEESYYYWRTSFKLDSAQRKKLLDKKVKNLFVRFFDIDRVQNRTRVISPIAWQDTINMPLTPVVFIKNRALIAARPKSLDSMALLILATINNIKTNTFKELQIDCDWTRSTQHAYFYLLRSLKEKLPTHIALTSTLRLHQLKYPDIAGVPPVQRATLMLYNVGDFNDVKTQNSIIDEAVVYDYLGEEDRYPLPLDIAVPNFEQAVLFRGGKYLTFFRNENFKNLLNSPLLKPHIKKDFFVLDKDSLFGTVSLIKGDLLRVEYSKKSAISNVLNKIKYQNSENRRLIWFDLH
jgi:hypothetical protein